MAKRNWFTTHSRLLSPYLLSVMNDTDKAQFIDALTEVIESGDERAALIRYKTIAYLRMTKQEQKLLRDLYERLAKGG